MDHTRHLFICPFCALKPPPQTGTPSYERSLFETRFNYKTLYQHMMRHIEEYYRRDHTIWIWYQVYFTEIFDQGGSLPCPFEECSFKLPPLTEINSDERRLQWMETICRHILEHARTHLKLIRPIVATNDACENLYGGHVCQECHCCHMHPGTHRTHRPLFVPGLADYMITGLLGPWYLHQPYLTNDQLLEIEETTIPPFVTKKLSRVKKKITLESVNHSTSDEDDLPCILVK